MMIDILALTATQILAIPLDSPERLYTGSRDVAHEEHLKLASKWHPRTDADDSAVAAHINALYDSAIRKLDKDIWSTPGKLRITAADGKVYEIHYRKHKTFELGDVYIGDKMVMYSITKDASDLFDSAIKLIKSLQYANDRMKVEISRYMPVILAQNETIDRKILVLSKPANALSLRDVFDHFKGKINGINHTKHVAWIISRLYNIACYLRYSHISHNDISLDTIFIIPEDHYVLLLGGWWYSIRKSETYRALPERTMSFMPTDWAPSKKGDVDYRIDTEMIHATGRELLGDIYGAKLNKDASIPKPMLNWLLGAGTEDARREWDTWVSSILKQSFGARRFVELKVTADDIYGKTLT